MEVMEVVPKPRLRGVFHQYAFLASVAIGVILVVAVSGTLERLSAIVFASTVSAMFGISALYHRHTWRPPVRRLMRRLDHAAIYLLIAGTYTPFGLLALEGGWRWSVLPIVWGGAFAAIVVKVAWIDGPKWLSAALAIGLGWVAVAALPELYPETGPHGLTLLAVGGLLYTAGAVVYASGRPDPVPTVFGYHEIFHLLVIGAAACQYVAVAFIVFGV
jgi:hemolysin III